jgi:DNA-binding LacI/PurR family transcriptional regulator
MIEKMRREGVQDITAEDLGKLWETRGKIDEERAAIEMTLQQIKDKAKEMGAEVNVCINNMNPETTVKCTEDLIAAGVKAIILAPGDQSSWNL